MTALAARLDPCVNWFKLMARTKGRILWLFPAVLLALYLASFAGTDPFEGVSEMLASRRANAPLLREARALDLDYQTVLAKPEAYVGKPIVWCIDRPSSDVSYVSGRPSWPVAVSGPYEYVGGHCHDVLAVIAGSDRGVIQLRPVEKL